MFRMVNCQTAHPVHLVDGVGGGIQRVVQKIQAMLLEQYASGAGREVL